ncbi:enoyl-CoA hydratase/isomerase family protein [Ramlibacter tataouinensis]|uniref:enoyl-CoA hydratase/isomerase family protein n=1 Tax=Ramlibacter tataouinensis TaxID=94132 RepID=UPI0022F3E0C8|nr:enoyl-CoA hydratase/isomerase family protein [Ramlibacter tataouinensis]WBY02752.1 enoyl-CoA hydratase/isomerase family protein [Ramlibacter tataouinensis]
MDAARHPIALAFEGAIAIATLDRPPVNAIDDAWVARLDAIVDEVEARDEVHVLRIRNAGRAFCAGADLVLMRERFATEAGRAQMVELARAMQQVFARIERSPKVSLAEIGGPALGGGLELALACDLRLAADTARLGLPEARLGLLPGAGGTQRLARICGDAVARQLILGAEVIDGTRAAALGLVHQCVPAAQLQAAARAQAERIAAFTGPALAACKRCITAAALGREDGFAAELEGTALLYAQADTQALVSRFLAG